VIVNSNALKVLGSMSNRLNS